MSVAVYLKSLSREELESLALGFYLQLQETNRTGSALLEELRIFLARQALPAAAPESNVNQ